MSLLMCSSVVVRRYAIILSLMTSTLLALVILYSSSRVLSFRVSSGSSRQSMTASWCSCEGTGEDRIRSEVRLEGQSIETLLGRSK